MISLEADQPLVAFISLNDREALEKEENVIGFGTYQLELAYFLVRLNLRSLGVERAKVVQLKLHDCPLAFCSNFILLSP